jgi:hypothetical protein
VGGPKTRGLRRGFAFAAAVGLHAGLVITLTAAFRTSTSPSSSTEFVGALIFLSAPLPPVASSNRRRPQVANKTSRVAPVEPPTPLPAVISFPIGADTAIDWVAEARRAAAAVTGARKVREFGRNPADSGHAPLRSSPAHEAGEQYRTADGGWIVWVSDRCYIVSEVPPLGLPQVLARSIPTRTVCQRDSEPRSDLFKDLPAYEKYHPQ